MTAVEELFARALELDPEERMELAERLRETCDAPDPGWWDSVKDEVHDTVAKIESGEMATAPWEQVRARIQERLSANRD